MAFAVGLPFVCFVNIDGSELILFDFILIFASGVPDVGKLFL